MFFKRILAVLILLCTLAGAARAEDALNVLLIGVDSSRGEARGRSDTMMLMRVDEPSGSIRLASFLRDLYVSIPGVGKTRLNAAYHYGGEELLTETLREQFGVEIDRTVTVQFKTLCNLVDDLGGIEVEIEPRELSALNKMIAEYNADYGLTGGQMDQSGLNVLDGRQALCYSRLRKIDSDFQRTSRQQAVIAALLRKVSQLDVWRLTGLALKYLGKVETDMTFQDVARLAPMLTKLENLTFQTAHVPFDGAYTDETVGGMMVLKPDLERTRRLLSAFLEE